MNDEWTRHRRGRKRPHRAPGGWGPYPTNATCQCNEWDEPHVGRPSHHTTRSCVLCVSTSLDSPRGGCWAVARETDPLMMPQGVVPEGSEGWWSVDLLLAGQHCTLPCMMRVANVSYTAAGMTCHPTGHQLRHHSLIITQHHRSHDRQTRQSTEAGASSVPPEEGTRQVISADGREVDGRIYLVSRGRRRGGCVVSGPTINPKPSQFARRSRRPASHLGGRQATRRPTRGRNPNYNSFLTRAHRRSLRIHSGGHPRHRGEG